MKKKFLTSILILCSILVLLTGCTSLDAGTVIDKSYSPAHTEVWYSHCNGYIIPHTVYYNDSYQLRLEGEQNGETVRDWVSVSEETYDTYAIGDQYPKAGN